MSFTVTATQSGNTQNGIGLDVRVVTGQNASPIGANAVSISANNKSITPTGTGSWVYGAVGCYQAGSTFTAESGTTFKLNAVITSPGDVTYGTFRTTGTMTAGTAVTVGSSSTPGAGIESVAALEILAGTGLAEDASTPAAVSGSATTIATAAFTPPAGSLLVAIVTCNQAASGGTLSAAITDSSGLGLTWVKQVTEGGSGTHTLTQVWTAVLPVVGPALGTPGLTFTANPLTVSVVTGTVPLGTPGLTFHANPLAISAGTHTTALGAPGLTFHANPLVPVILNPFPKDPLVVMVELLIGDTWTDISEWVYFSEANDQIAITGGRPDESGFVNPASLALEVNNNDGRFSPKNANGPWFGQFGRNTQIRVSVQATNPFNQTMQYRAWQEVSDWPFTWSPNDVDRRGQLQAAGVLRRLQQSGSLGTSPANLALPLTAYYTQQAGTPLAFTAWWPCTDAAGSTQFASGLVNGPAMTFSGAPGLAAFTDFPGSAAIPTFGKSVWTGLLSGVTQTAGTSTLVTATFNESGTFQAPPGTTVIQSGSVTGPGGGGASGVGGGSPESGGGGGGGGVTPISNAPVTPGNVYPVSVGEGGAGAPPGGGDGADGSGDSTFPADSGDITGGAGSGASGTSGGSGGSGTDPGGTGGAGEAGSGDTGAGGGGAGGGDGAIASPFVGGGAGGYSGLGGSGGSGGISPSGSGASGGSPGGGGGGAASGSTGYGGNGGNGQVVLKYQRSGGGNIIVSGGSQNANVLRYCLLVPAAGDLDGAPITSMPTSGTVASLVVVYHAGAAVLSAALGTGAITTIAVNPLPFAIPTSQAITVFGDNGASETFTTSAGASAGASSVSITSVTPTITASAGAAIMLGNDAPGYLELQGTGSGGSQLFTSGLCNFGVDGTPYLVSAELAQSGTSVAWTLQAMEVGETVPVVFTGTLASASVGSVGGVVGNPYGELDGTAAGQFTIQYATSALSGLAAPVSGYAGEAAANRFLRLCGQQGVTAQVVGDPDNSVPMGIQDSDTFVNLVQDCETADMGLVFEPRTFFGLCYRTRTSMLSQAPGADLDYAAFKLPDDPALTPDYDDQYTSNDVLVTRENGSSLEVTLQEGRLSVQAPPNGVGQYASSVTVNLFADRQLPDVAGWLLWRSTVDEYRFPTLAVRMEYPEVGQTDLFGAVSSIDVGDFVQISNPPSWLVSDDIKQIVYGNTETIKPFSWVFAWNAVPESPYEVASADSTTFRADTTGSTLVTGINATATMLNVATTQAASALWDTTGADDPFDISLNGERMTVTSVVEGTPPGGSIYPGSGLYPGSGGNGSQVFVVVRSVNGVSKAHAASEAVTLFNPPVASI